MQHDGGHACLVNVLVFEMFGFGGVVAERRFDIGILVPLMFQRTLMIFSVFGSQCCRVYAL